MPALRHRHSQWADCSIVKAGACETKSSRPSQHRVCADGPTDETTAHRSSNMRDSGCSVVESSPCQSVGVRGGSGRTARSKTPHPASQNAHGADVLPYNTQAPSSSINIHRHLQCSSIDQHCRRQLQVSRTHPDPHSIHRMGRKRLEHT